MVTKQVVVKEFSPVIGVETEEEKERQFIFDLLEGLLDTFIAFVPYSSILGPTAEKHQSG